MGYFYVRVLILNIYTLVMTNPTCQLANSWNLKQCDMIKLFWSPMHLRWPFEAWSPFLVPVNYIYWLHCFFQQNHAATVTESCQTSDCGLAACQGFSIMTRPKSPTMYSCVVTFGTTVWQQKMSLMCKDIRTIACWRCTIAQLRGASCIIPQAKHRRQKWWPPSFTYHPFIVKRFVFRHNIRWLFCQQWFCCSDPSRKDSWTANDSRMFMNNFAGMTFICNSKKSPVQKN